MARLQLGANSEIDLFTAQKQKDELRTRPKILTLSFRPAEHRLTAPFSLGSLRWLLLKSFPPHFAGVEKSGKMLAKLAEKRLFSSDSAT